MRSTADRSAWPGPGCRRTSWSARTQPSRVLSPTRSKAAGTMAWFLAMPAKPAQNIEGRSPGLEVPRLAQSAVILAVALGVGLGASGVPAASAFAARENRTRDERAKGRAERVDQPVQAGVAHPSGYEVLDGARRSRRTQARAGDRDKAGARKRNMEAQRVGSRNPSIAYSQKWAAGESKSTYGPSRLCCMAFRLRSSSEKRPRSPLRFDPVFDDMNTTRHAQAGDEGPAHGGAACAGDLPRAWRGSFIDVCSGRCP